jgi:thiosulfate/3-mercaptopyruvate sulfurtransferase
MKTLKALFILFLFIASRSHAQNPVNWTPDQLMAPAHLAERLKSGTNKPLIFCVGPGALIPGSIDIGPGKERESLEKLTRSLHSLKKDTSIVIYCGCCPFEHCPNVRPAIALLKDLHFSNYKLLNLPHNLKTDWLDKGYPTVKE